MCVAHNERPEYYYYRQQRRRVVNTVTVGAYDNRLVPGKPLFRHGRFLRCP